MPSSTTSVKRSFRTTTAKSSSRLIESAISIGELIHPSRPAIFRCTSPSPLQADGSRCHSAPAARSAVGVDALSMSVSGPGVSVSDS